MRFIRHEEVKESPLTRLLDDFPKKQIKSLSFLPMKYRQRHRPNTDGGHLLPPGPLPRFQTAGCQGAYVYWETRPLEKA